MLGGVVSRRPRCLSVSGVSLGPSSQTPPPSPAPSSSSSSRVLSSQRQTEPLGPWTQGGGREGGGEITCTTFEKHILGSVNLVVWEPDTKFSTQNMTLVQWATSKHQSY